MLRNILRTSRCLARRQINSFTPIVLRQSSFAEALKLKNNFTVVPRSFSTSPQSSEHVDPVVFEEICSETLESLCDYFEELIEKEPSLKGADVTYSDGVLTVALNSHGTYVINRQSPNKQIWLSSPISGPKRYDLVLKGGGHWVYKHDGIPLHKLLQTEIEKIVTAKVDFSQCSHSLV